MKLAREFYQRTSLVVAKELLGKTLVHHSPEGKTSGRIVEVEAYKGPDDAAAHSYQNRRSKRTEVMFGAGGFAYVYFIYGMYHCMNVVASQVNRPEAVLIRALEPIEGIELMQKRRKTEKPLNLCSGPGKLAMAMGIDKRQYGTDLCGDTLYIKDDTSHDFEVVIAKRINIDYAGEAKDYPWRFLIKNNRYVSVKG